MKQLIYIITPIVLLCSCVTSKHVGQLNMVSTRNIETMKTYELLQKNVELSKKGKRQSKAENIQQAINDVVKKHPSGEYLMNANVYLVTHHYFFFYTFFYAVDGDIWGSPTKKVTP